MARLIAFAAALLLAAAPALAAPKTTVVMAKVGKTNVQIRILLHPQVDQCSAPLSKELRAEATRLGAAHVRENLAKLIKKAGTDASGASEFFGVSYLAGCPKDGSAWLAFPVEGKDKSVTRFQPGLGWSGMMKL